jgi:transcriptional regulator with XRE-family HTH domain
MIRAGRSQPSPPLLKLADLLAPDFNGRNSRELKSKSPRVRNVPKVPLEPEARRFILAVEAIGPRNAAAARQLGISANHVSNIRRGKAVPSSHLLTLAETCAEDPTRQLRMPLISELQEVVAQWRSMSPQHQKIVADFHNLFDFDVTHSAVAK